MRRTITVLAVAALAAVSVHCGGKARPSSRTPITAGVTELQMSPEELRIRVRALIRPVLGTIEETADRVEAESTDPGIRRFMLNWKFEATSTLLAALLRPDPVLALADAWGYVMQMEELLQTPSMREALGAGVPPILTALESIQQTFRDFADNVQEDLSSAPFESRLREWAREHPIEGALYRRPSMDSAVAADLAKARPKGAIAAIGNLEETAADLVARMDLYTVYLPRLARWESELVLNDVLGDVDVGGAVEQFERFTGATAQLADAAESATSTIAVEREIILRALGEEREIILDAVRGEREIVMASIRQERMETLGEIERIAERLLDRSGGPVQEAVREQLEDLVDQIEDMRTKLMEEAEVVMLGVVDHVFYRALQLLLLGAILAAVGLFVHARFLRR